MKTVTEEWKRDIYDTLKEVEKSQDLLSMYQRLDKIARENDDAIGEVVELNSDMGGKITVVLGNEGTTVDVETPYEEKNLVSDLDYRYSEFQSLMDYDLDLKDANEKIGQKYPEVLKDMLKGLDKNDMLVANNGTAYVCDEKTDEDITLRKVYDATKKNNDFYGRNTVRTYTFSDERDLQDLYDSAKDPHTGNVIMQIANTEREQEYVQNKLDNAAVGNQHLDEGLNIRVTKGVLDKSGKLVGPRKEEVSKEQAAYALAWLENAPVKTDFLYKTDEAKQNEFVEDVTRMRFEELCADEKYTEAYKMLSDYALSQAGDVAVKVSSYRKTDEVGRRKSEAYTFTDRGTVVSAYDDKDNQYHVNYAKEGQFREFCEEKYSNAVMVENEHVLGFVEKYKAEIEQYLETIKGMSEIKQHQQEKEQDRQYLEQKIDAYMRGYMDLQDVVADREEYIELITSFNEMKENALVSEKGKEPEKMFEKKFEKQAEKEVEELER